MDVSAADFQQQVLLRSREVPILVDFWADWCQPCKILSPILENLAGEFDGAFESISHSLSTALYRNGTGSVGQVGSGVTGGTMTLKDLNDIAKFGTNTRVGAAAAARLAADAGTDAYISEGETLSKQDYGQFRKTGKRPQ